MVAGDNYGMMANGYSFTDIHRCVQIDETGTIEEAVCADVQALVKWTLTTQLDRSVKYNLAVNSMKPNHAVCCRAEGAEGAMWQASNECLTKRDAKMDIPPLQSHVCNNLSDAPQLMLDDKWFVQRAQFRYPLLYSTDQATVRSQQYPSQRGTVIARPQGSDSNSR